MSRGRILFLFHEKLSEMDMLDAVDAAAACPFVQAHHVFRVVVVYGFKIAELPFPCVLVGNHICSLHVDSPVVLFPHEVNLLSSAKLPRIHFIPFLEEMQEDCVLDKLVDVLLHTES